MPNSPSTPLPEPHRLRVLLVDDMPAVRQELRTLLQITGELDIAGEAADGQEAIWQAQALQPDVVIMDLEMPGMDGCEATRQIKANHLAKRVVILSVHAAAGAEQRVRQAGADAFVQKGASLETLMLAIQSNTSSLIEKKG